MCLIRNHSSRLVIVWGVLGLLGVAVPSHGASPFDDRALHAGASDRIPLDEHSFGAWRDHIQADKSELAWTRIPWQSTLRDGIVLAAAQRKPLLLWVMNGHPLGCT